MVNVGIDGGAFKLRDALRHRDFVSSLASDDRPRLRREGERRTAAPILEAHFAAGLGVPGSVGLLIKRLSASSRRGGVQIDKGGEM